MMRMTKAGIALIAASALALGACSGGSSDKGSGAEGGAAELPASDYNKVDRDELQDGGTLRLAWNSYPEQWNPYHIDGNNVDISSTYAAYTMPLNWIYAADGGSFEPNPNFMESYEVNDEGEGGDAMTLHLKLSPDAHWNDGTPITYKDYEASWKACNHQIDGVACASDDGFKEITGIEAGENEFEVVVHYSVKYPDWSSTWSTVGNAKGVSDANSFNEGYKDPVKAADLYTGPFIATNSDTAQGVLTLNRNPNWWGPQAKLDTVTFSTMKSEAQAAGFANGEIDVLDFIVDAATYETAKQRTDAKITISSSVQWRHFTFNSRAGALSDKNVRQAIQLGINTEDITASDLSGLPVEHNDMHLGNHFFMPNQAGYVDNSIGFDPEAAKAKLEEAGYTMNETTGFYEKDGQKLSLRYLRLPDVPTSTNEGAMFQEMMKDIGVEVTFQDVESKDFFPSINSGEYEITSFAWNGTPYPMANVGQIYGKPFDEDGNLLNSNFTGVTVPEVEDLLPKIAAETDVDKRRELTNEADKAIWDNVMTLPLYYRANITAIPEGLANYGSTAFETLLTENIGYTK